MQQRHRLRSPADLKRLHNFCLRYEQWFHTVANIRALERATDGRPAHRVEKQTIILLRRDEKIDRRLVEREAAACGLFLEIPPLLDVRKKRPRGPIKNRRSEF